MELLKKIIEGLESYTFFTFPGRLCRQLLLHGLFIVADLILGKLSWEVVGHGQGMLIIREEGGGVSSSLDRWTLSTQLYSFGGRELICYMFYSGSVPGDVHKKLT